MDAGFALNTPNEFWAPVAIDRDGTLVAVNNGYIFALGGVVLGDMNGDGCRDNADIDAYVLAVFDPIASEHTDSESPETTGFGERFGINLLGIGDCNNDGVFDNGDIDGFVAALLE